MRRIALVLIGTMALSALFVGCGGREVVSKTTPIQKLKSPEWVVKGGGAFTSDEGRVFFGVGSAASIRNYELLRNTADNRARSDISKVLQFYTASLMKDYMASTSAGEPGVTAEEQHVEQAIKTVASITLSGVEIVDHWQNPDTGELFSLVRVDLETFKENLQKAGELDQRTRERIRQNADRLHEELSRETEQAE